MISDVHNQDSVVHPNSVYDYGSLVQLDYESKIFYIYPYAFYKSLGKFLYSMAARSTYWALLEMMLCQTRCGVDAGVLCARMYRRPKD